MAAKEAKIVKAVIFDMDGVFFDSYEAWFKVFNRARKRFGFEEITRQEFDKNCWSVDSSILIPKYFPGRAIKEVTGYYGRIFFDFMEDIRMTPDVKETLDTLKRKGIRLAVATNTYRDQAKRILGRLGLYSYFDIIVGADEVRAGKPEPDILYKAVKGLGLNMDEVIFIGDTDIDMKTCRNAGCRTIGFKIDGDRRIDRFKDLIKVI